MLDRRSYMPVTRNGRRVPAGAVRAGASIIPMTHANRLRDIQQNPCQLPSTSERAEMRRVRRTVFWVIVKYSDTFCKMSRFSAIYGAASGRITIRALTAKYLAPYAKFSTCEEIFVIAEVSEIFRQSLRCRYETNCNILKQKELRNWHGYCVVNDSPPVAGSVVRS